VAAECGRSEWAWVRNLRTDDVHKRSCRSLSCVPKLGAGIGNVMSEIALRELLRPFATSIHVKATALGQFETKGILTRRQRARFLESIADDIKKCTNLLTPRASKAAAACAKLLGIELLDMHWHNQCRFDRGRVIFHWEHMVPVKAIRDRCRAANSQEEVLEILATQICVVWILKRTLNLNRLGYRIHRDDPAAAYRHAGIEL
jgi:hypothetical protein